MVRGPPVVAVFTVLSRLPVSSVHPQAGVWCSGTWFEMDMELPDFYHQGAENNKQLEMWANAQRDGRPAKYKWHPLFNAAKFD